MENKTRRLIERLAQLNSFKQINDFVENEHANIKNGLMQLGIVFDYEENPLGGQSLSGRENVINGRFYEELNYLRKGINGNWRQNLTERDRFDEIQRDVREITDLL